MMETTVINVLFIKHQKKALKKFGIRTWCTKKPWLSSRTQNVGQNKKNINHFNQNLMLLFI